MRTWMMVIDTIGLLFGLGMFGLGSSQVLGSVQKRTRDDRKGFLYPGLVIYTCGVVMVTISSYRILLFLRSIWF